MTTEDQVQKILQMVNNIKNLLPMFATNKLTLRLESEQEVKDIAAALNVSYMKPNANFNFHWCLYKSGPVTVNIQTEEVEQEQEVKNLTFN